MGDTSANDASDSQEQLQLPRVDESFFSVSEIKEPWLKARVSYDRKPRPEFLGVTMPDDDLSVWIPNRLDPKKPNMIMFWLTGNTGKNTGCYILANGKKIKFTMTNLNSYKGDAYEHFINATKKLVDDDDDNGYWEKLKSWEINCIDIRIKKFVSVESDKFVKFLKDNLGENDPLFNKLKERTKPIEFSSGSMFSLSRFKRKREIDWINDETFSGDEKKIIQNNSR